jgi:putative oxidoreductase
LAAAQAAARRGTTDLGLLALRVAVGLIAMAHGAQKLFGWWNGPRLSGFEAFLANNPNPDIGFRGDATKPLAIVGALSESLGGLMLVLGLLTPIAGAAVLGVMIIAATYKATLAGGVWFFASGQAGTGIEYEVFLGIAAAVIILTGPGRISLDFGRGWATRPFVGSVAWLVIGIAAPVAIWILLNGTNPFHSPGNPTSG